MTNADVVEMVAAGLPDSTIILAIHNSETRFDTSENAIAEMEAAGVSQSVLEALRKTEKIPQPANPREISRHDVYLIEGDKRTLMLKGQFKGRFVSGGFVMRLTTKTFMGIDGKLSQLRVADTTPVFEASLPADVNAAEKLVVVRLKQKSKVREIQVRGATLVGSHKGFREKDIVPTTFEEVKTYLADDGAKYIRYRVRAVKPLPSGEYAFVPFHYLRDYYDFGIDKPQK